ncbi:FAD-dependent oxidoreductase [Streptomyces sp. NPDC017991]|uniref:FAD-dependent oxidoreductase n=1 Tax=Streptomyces sp. NPDC017991 TaxID=3365026 RepID=UPI0037B86D46
MPHREVDKLSTKSTVIVGGGLVGLTAAASLKLIGHDVIVLEQAPRIRAFGAGVGLWVNALREFDHIGIGATPHCPDTWVASPFGRTRSLSSLSASGSHSS